MGSSYHVPDTEIEVEFKPTAGGGSPSTAWYADLVVITNEENGTHVEMTMQDWFEFASRARVAHSLAV